MEIKQLKSFIAVVDCGNFTKAAEKTYTSQPTISTHIRALEDELGTRLIARDTKNIKITDKGYELYDCAVHIIELQENLMKRWAEEDKSYINLGASTIPSAYILPELMAEFSQLHPEISLIIHQGDSTDVAEGLLSGLYDLGLLGMDCSSDKLKCDPFYRDETVLITPNNAEFQALKQLESDKAYEEIFRHPIIYREKGSGTQKAAEAIIEKLGFDLGELNVIARINDQETIKNLVAAGVGVSLVSWLAVREYEKGGSVLVFRLPKGDSERRFYMAVNKESYKSAAVKAFMRYVKRNYPD
jgi:DNA-binding transcriptional LysR family regulator